jgi:NAD(P)-dependent dehydrogenase (short-subunit alcohol dehydrogenase family)
MLNDKVIVITGGGSGIGEGAAKVIAGYGAKVVIGDIDMIGAERVVAEIAAAGGQAAAFHCNVAQDDQVRSLIAGAVTTFGRLDGAFNNAGIPGRYLPTIELEESDWNLVLGIDLVGTWTCIRHEIAAIRATADGRGAIVNNASNAGLTGVPTLAAYAAAKAGVINLTKTVAVEHGPEGLRVNAICPGTIDTPPVHASRLAGHDFTGQAQKAPLRRLGTMAEAGELVAWLLSDKASYITGQAISIDGGTSACF